jgi:hypothetical protein
LLVLIQIAQIVLSNIARALLWPELISRITLKVGGFEGPPKRLRIQDSMHQRAHLNL